MVSFSIFLALSLSFYFFLSPALAQAQLATALLIWHSIMSQHMTFELNDLKSVPAGPAAAPPLLPLPLFKLCCLTNTFYELINVGNGQIRVGQEDTAHGSKLKSAGKATKIHAVSSVQCTCSIVHCLLIGQCSDLCIPCKSDVDCNKRVRCVYVM